MKKKLSILEKMNKRGEIFFDLYKEIRCAKCGECLNNERDHLTYDTDSQTGQVINIKCYHHITCPQPRGLVLWNHINNIGWDMIYKAWHDQEDTVDEPFQCDVKLFWKRKNE